MVSGSDSVRKTFKVLILGDSSVGKTCLIVRAVGGTTANSVGGELAPTVGVDMRQITVPLPGQAPVKLQVWDTAGQERFRSIARQYFRGAHGVIVVYDVTRRNSFVAVRSWLTTVLSAAEPDCVVVVVGNKADVAVEDRAVLKEEGEALCAELGGLPFIETSAVTGLGVDEVFAQVASKLREAPKISTANSTRNTSSSDDSAPRSASSLQRRVEAVDMDDITARGIKLHEERKAAQRRSCSCG